MNPLPSLPGSWEKPSEGCSQRTGVNSYSPRLPRGAQKMTLFRQSYWCLPTAQKGCTHSFQKKCLHGPLLTKSHGKAPAQPRCSALFQQFQFSEGEPLAWCKQDPRNPSVDTPHTVLPHQPAILTLKVGTNIQSCCKVRFSLFPSFLQFLLVPEDHQEQRIPSWVAALPQV